MSQITGPHGFGCGLAQAKKITPRISEKYKNNLTERNTVKLLTSNPLLTVYVARSCTSGSSG